MTELKAKPELVSLRYACEECGKKMVDVCIVPLGFHVICHDCYLDFKLRVSRKTKEKCPNNYYQDKRNCGNAHNCNPKICKENRIKVALSTKGDN